MITNININEFVNEMKSTSSLNEKKVIIDSIKNNKFITKALNYALDPYKKYYITSKTCKKMSHICDEDCGFVDLFELFYNDPKLSEILSEKIETSLEAEIIELNSRKKIILNKLDDLLLETFQTTGILIDEQKLVNGEEGCLCNIDLEYIQNGAKQGLFDLDTVDVKSQEKIGYRLNQIFKFLEN